MLDVAILTVSDRAARGSYADESGALLAEIVSQQAGWQLSQQLIVPDERPLIATTLRRWSTAGIALILTTGGTGFAARDVTPEATRDVIEREAPGLAEAMRAASLTVTPHAMLSRAVAGIRGQTLIVNLPGSPKAVRENMATILPALPHALALIAGSSTDHHSTIV